MDFNKICFNCMKEKTSEESVCPNCGFDNRKYRSAENHLPPLTPLNGKYILGRVLGEGGFGITYIAFDTHLQVVVAIKELYIKQISSRNNANTICVQSSNNICFEENKERFLQEARILAMFNESDSEGIVQVKDHFEENNTAYIVMECLNGKTLKQLAFDGRMNLDETLKLTLPIFSSLSKIHKMGVVHLDVSPDNIMVMDDGRAKLMDFGGARNLQDSDSGQGSIALKRGYAPPEQYSRKGNIGPWTDEYAMAAVIYYCITGKKPVDSMDRKAGQELVRPSAYGAKISAPAENAIVKALQMNPEDRFKSMDEFASELQKRHRTSAKIIGVAAGVAFVAAAAAILIAMGVFTGNKQNAETVSSDIEVIGMLVAKDRETESITQTITAQPTTMLSEPTTVQPATMPPETTTAQPSTTAQPDTTTLQTTTTAPETQSAQADIMTSAEQNPFDITPITEAKDESQMDVIESPLLILAGLDQKERETDPETTTAQPTTTAPPETTTAQPTTTASPETTTAQPTTTVPETSEESEGQFNPYSENAVGDYISVNPGTYIFENSANRNLIMGIDSGFGDDGAGLILKNYEDTNSNRFAVVPDVAGSGFYNFRAGHTNSFVETLNESGIGTSFVQNSEYLDTGTQKIVFIYCGYDDDKDMAEVILETAGGTVLSPEASESAGISAGSRIVLAEKNENDYTQRWFIRWSEKDTSEQDVVVHHAGDLVENLNGMKIIGSGVDGTRKISVSDNTALFGGTALITWENVWSDIQKFEFVLQGDSRYKIYPAAQSGVGRQCLEFDPVSLLIYVKEESDSPYQLFRAVYTGYNMYLIQAYDESVLGFDAAEDGSIDGRAVLSRPYDAIQDSRFETWLIEAAE